MGLQIEQPLSIREQVYKRISDLIINGKIAPTERIVEHKLAQQLGVSRTPVREALHVLEMEGFLDAIPRIGYQLKEIHWDEVDEICEIRKINETLAVRWAVERITPEELDSLKENLDSAQADIAKGPPERFVDRDADFHEKLVRASGSQRLVEICQILRRHMLRYRMESISNPETAMGAIAGHRNILERLREHDLVGVEKAIGDHLDFVKTDLHQYALKMNKIKG
jgi:DNA-binding GntR family transcriptional regulator